MRILFGHALDSTVWPSLLGTRQAVLGEAVVGERTFLALLEIALGTRGPDQSRFDRILSFRKALKDVDSSERFYHASLERDPLAVARHLLQIRDELVLAGWDGRSTYDQPRIKDLAAVEISGSTAIHGDPDRLLRVIEALKARSSTPVAHLTLAEPVETHCILWRQVIELLQKLGTTCVPHTAQFKPAPGDLGALQSSSTQKPAPQGDGSYRLLTCQDPWQAARWTVAWLTAQKSTTPEQTVIIVPERYRRILAAAFAEREVPFGGTTETSSYARPALQVLLLALSLAWAPKNPQAALALMLLPTSPIPKDIVPDLLSALGEAPAIGSEEWNLAIQEGISRIQTYENGPERAAKAQERIETWLHAPAQDPQQGMRAYELGEICDRFSKWARGYAQISEGKSFLEAAELADTLGQTVRDLEANSLTSLTPDQLQTLLRDIIGTGVSGASDHPRAGGPSIVTSPQCILDSAETVLWWDFSASTSLGITSSFWSVRERAFLRSKGVLIQEPSEIAIQHSKAWMQPLRAAQKRFLAITFAANAEGEAEYPHPLHDQILPAAHDQARLWNIATMISPGLSDTPTTRHFEAEAGAVLHSPKTGTWAPKLDWAAPKDVLKLRDQESASSLETLLGCMLAYTLRYGAHLSKPTHTLPDGPLLSGKIAHKVFEHIFLKDSHLNAAQAEAAARSELQKLMPIYAAPLLAAVRQAERTQLERDILRAAAAYASFLQNNDLEIIDAERTIQGKLPEFAPTLGGKIDHVLGKRGKTSLIIDHKTSGSSHRQNTLSKGLALQLSIYAHLESTKDILPNIGYFIIRDGKPLILNATQIKDATIVKGDSPEIIWNRARQEIAHRQKLLSQGNLQAEGLLEEPIGPWEPECAFCSYEAICGKRWTRE